MVNEEVRQKNNLPLRQLCLRIFQLKNDRVSEEDMLAMGINLLALDHSPEEGYRPLFFEILSKQRYKTLQDQLDFHWPEFRDEVPYCRAYEMGRLLQQSLKNVCWPHSSESKIDWRLRNINDTAFEKGFFKDISPRPRWEVSIILDMFNTAIPHLGCILYDETSIEDDQLSRSELYCVTALMTGRLSLGQYANHQIVPVSIYSFSDCQARIIQAHYRQPSLNISKSEIFDLKTNDDMGKIEIFFRWMMSTPVGQTTFTTPPEESFGDTSRGEVKPPSKENEPPPKAENPPPKERQNQLKENKPPTKKENKPPMKKPPWKTG